MDDLRCYKCGADCSFMAGEIRPQGAICLPCFDAEQVGFNLAPFYTPLTRAETELAQDLLYFISPVEGEPRPPDAWNAIEYMVFARWAVRVGIWELTAVKR